MYQSETRELIAAWLDGRISESDSQLLQDQLRRSAEARAMFREFVKLDAAIREVASGDNETKSTFLEPTSKKSEPIESRSHWQVLASRWSRFVLAASALIAVGGIAYWFGKSDTPASTELAARVVDVPSESAERTMAGYATLRRVAGIKWNEHASSYREGDVLPAGVLEFDDGVAEIDFFCGATLIVEGPAKLELESDWSVRMLAGRLRAKVPPAARGFVVKAADSEIVDLGTEFALEVGAENVRLEVVDGEVKLRGGRYDGEHLITGQGQSLIGTVDNGLALKNLSTLTDIRLRHESAQRRRFGRWKEHSAHLRTDERLVAYFPIADSVETRTAPNASAAGSELDGILVGSVNQIRGRFGPESTGLKFDRPGARVRTLIDGEFESFTFACWVNIDSLAHKYNALFMGDGYENGEPHWQIRDDGRLMFSVMVDDSQDIQVKSAFDQKLVPDAGLHRVYYSEPFWDVSKSGQWFHLAAVYDPGGRRVTQYVDGQMVSDEEIIDKFYIKTLRIGPAEIGNWGQPFRKSPWFAVRNLNGTIDELAVFDAALSHEEINALHEQGKPLGY